MFAHLNKNKLSEVDLGILETQQEILTGIKLITRAARAQRYSGLPKERFYLEEKAELIGDREGYIMAPRKGG